MAKKRDPWKEKYAAMDADEKREMLGLQNVKYTVMDTGKQRKMLEQKQAKQKAKYIPMAICNEHWPQGEIDK